MKTGTKMGSPMVIKPQYYSCKCDSRSEAYTEVQRYYKNTKQKHKKSSSICQRCNRGIWSSLTIFVNDAIRAFGLVVWFSLWVREVPSSILGMPLKLSLAHCFKTQNCSATEGKQRRHKIKTQIITTDATHPEDQSLQHITSMCSTAVWQ